MKEKNKQILKSLIFPAFVLISLSITLCLAGCNLNSEEKPKDTVIQSPEAENKVDPSQDTDTSFLYDTSIVDLQGSSASIMDGQTVQIEGEAIGDVRNVDFDDTHYWITLQAEEKNKYDTITVYCTKNTTNLIDTFGSYKYRGTMLQIRGTFQIACSTHDGLCDIHAETSSVKTKGSKLTNSFSFESFSFGIVAIIFGAVMLLFYAYLAKRKKNTELQEEEIQEEVD